MDRIKFEAAVLAGMRWHARVESGSVVAGVVEAWASRLDIPLRMFVGEGATSETSNIIVGLPIAMVSPGDDPVAFSLDDVASALARFEALQGLHDELREFQPDNRPYDPYEGVFVMSTSADGDARVSFGAVGTRDEARESRSTWIGQPSAAYEGNALGIIGCFVNRSLHSASVLHLDTRRELDARQAQTHRESVGESADRSSYFLSAFRRIDGHEWPAIADLDALLAMIETDVTEQGFRGVAPGSSLADVVSKLGLAHSAQVDADPQQTLRYQAPLDHPTCGRTKNSKLIALFVGYHWGPVSSIDLHISGYPSYGDQYEYYKTFVKRLKSRLKERWGKPEREGPKGRNGSWVYWLDGDAPVSRIVLMLPEAGNLQLHLQC